MLNKVIDRPENKVKPIKQTNNADLRWNTLSKDNFINHISVLKLKTYHS